MSARPSYAHIAHHTSFEHERLMLSERSIRLVQVQRGGKDEPISLRMTQFSAHRRPKYKAVSYTWGSSANPKSILVNGRAFLLHTNLWDLLYHLRLSGETSFLWADALCINQLNLRERNFHVQLMGRIYQAAEAVIVWLGVPSPDRIEIRAFDFVKEIAAYRKANSDANLANMYFTTAMRPRWETLFKMTDHYYWHRTWIIQEFLFALDVEVFSGRYKLDWHEFEDLLDFLRQEPRVSNHPIIPSILQSRTTRLTLRRKATGRSNLHDLLKEYSDSTCTERRDKVYGILGLAADCAEDPSTGEPVGIKPDYDNHILELYIEALGCITMSLTSDHASPDAALLVLRALHVKPQDLSDFASMSGTPQQQERMVTGYLMIMPRYVSTILNVFYWTGVRDLQAQLEAYDWGEHIGYEVKKMSSNTLAPATRIRLRRHSSRTIHAALPTDFITNVTEAAHLCQDIYHLHNYPAIGGLEIPLDHICLHSEDKRLFGNTELSKPPVILEQNSDNGLLRLGFACSTVQRGDQIIQFRGLDQTLVIRQTGYVWSLLGKALMIKNQHVTHEEPIDSTCDASKWSSHCWSSQNPEGVQFATTALALAELLLRT